MKRSISALVAATVGAALLPTTFASAQDATGTITGTVTAEDGGAPVADVCVDAVAFSGSDPFETRTAQDGTYELEVPADVYLMVFNACAEPLDGYVGTIRGFEEGAEEEPLVEVRAGTTTGDVDVSLATAGTITGHVTEDGSGDALGDVCVQAHEATAVLPATAATAADGSYRITTAAPGDNEVAFIGCESPRLHVPELYDDVPLWPLSEDPPSDAVPVTAGATTSGIDASLAPGGSITGTVALAHTGEPPAWATVGAWASDDRDELPTAIAFAGFDLFQTGPVVAPQTSEPGRFELPGLPAGDYALELAPEAFGFGDAQAWLQRWYVGPREGTDEREDAAVIELSASEQVTDLQLELVPSPSIDPLCEGSQADYPDVSPSNVHAVAIGCMRDAGVVKGGDDGRYRPGAPVRRDQMASFLVRLLQYRDPSILPSDPPDAFSDDDGNVHEPSIDMLAAVGIVEGDASGRYRPDGVVGRGQMATFLARAYEFGSDATLRTPSTSFGDVEGTAHATSIRKVAVAAIAAGTSPSTYEPNEVVRREQMATFLARLHHRLILDAGWFVMSSSGSVQEGASGSSSSSGQLFTGAALGWARG